jgi:hypothetical protein
MPLRVTLGVLFTKLILHPALMTLLVVAALSLRLFTPPDALFLLTLLLSNATPTAINLQVRASSWAAVLGCWFAGVWEAAQLCLLGWQARLLAGVPAALPHTLLCCCRCHCCGHLCLSFVSFSCLLLSPNGYWHRPPAAVAAPHRAHLAFCPCFLPLVPLQTLMVLYRHGEAEMSTLLYWQYLASALTVPAYMWLFQRIIVAWVL